MCVCGVRIGQTGFGDSVAIIGAGSIGLLCILTAKRAGASEVVISARHPHQQQLAKAMAADRVYDSAKAYVP